MVKRGPYKKHKLNPTSFTKKTAEEAKEFWFNSEGHKRCSRGNHYAPVENFGPHKNAAFGLNPSCRVCVNERARSLHHRRKHDPDYKAYVKNQYTQRAFGLTAIEYESILNSQSCCAICGDYFKDLGSPPHLDHNHSTGALREFLCNNCNRGLGHFKDSPEILNAAVQYLEKHK